MAGFVPAHHRRILTSMKLALASSVHLRTSRWLTHDRQHAAHLRQGCTLQASAQIRSESPWPEQATCQHNHELYVLT
jgi:hypothetical protein